MVRFPVRFIPVVTLFVLTFCVYPVFAQYDGDEIQSVVGVDTLPHVIWSFPDFLNIHGTDEIDYDMEASSFTSYGANVRINRLNASFGLSAMIDDEVIGEVDRYTGYLAVKNIFVRYSKGNIKGTADWTGALATDMPSSFSYDHDVSAYEINYMFNGKDSDSMGWYVGLGYTTMTVPIEIHTMTTSGGKENQVYGVPIYDNAYEVDAYCIQFGFDTMVGEMAKGLIKPGTIKFFAHAQDTLGFGQGTVSPESAVWAEELNGPGRTFEDRKSVVAYLQNDSTIGFFWAPSLLRGHGVLALGYNLNFCFLGTFEGAAEHADELGYDASYGMLRHGPQFRAYATW